MWRRIGAVFFVAVAAAVAVHAVVEPLYHVPTEGEPYAPLWDVLDPVMVVAVALGAVLAWRRKRAADRRTDGTAIREYLAANALFAGFLFVGVLLLRNWFDQLTPGSAAAGADTVVLTWLLVDAALPVLCGATGAGLWTGKGRGDG